MGERSPCSQLAAACAADHDIARQCVGKTESGSRCIAMASNAPMRPWDPNGIGSKTKPWRFDRRSSRCLGVNRCHRDIIETIGICRNHWDGIGMALGWQRDHWDVSSAIRMPPSAMARFGPHLDARVTIPMAPDGNPSQPATSQWSPNGCQQQG